MAGMDRDKALSAALSNIERAHGKGAIMRLGDEARAPMDVIPTGSVALDVALGIGGLPRGRVVEIYGPESSGKCLTADTLVWTDRGLETVAELFERCGQKASCTSRVTDVSELGIRLVNESGVLEPLVAITHNNRKPVVNLTLRSGRRVSVTANHPLRVMSERGFIVWRPAAAITVGDTVVSAEFGAIEAAAGDGLSEDEAVLLGYLVAEGSMSAKNAVRFTNWDPEVAEEFATVYRAVFGDGKEIRKYGNGDYAVHSTSARISLAERYGLDYVNAAGKCVPHCVRVAGHKAQRAFLSALFEGDGWIDPTSTVGLGTASERLARQVQLLLYGLGVPATVAATFNKTYQRHYWSVIVNPASAGRFLTEVGFRSERRAGQVSAHYRASIRTPQFENIPHLAGLLTDLRDDLGGDRAFDRLAGDLFRANMNLSCSKTRLRKIVAWIDTTAPSLSPSSAAIVAHLRALVDAAYSYECVTAVEDGGLQPTFDVVLPQTHSFIANGMLSHNTTVALHAVANAQKAGGIAAFIDAEHALDPEYAKALGVDTDELLVSQPDTGEQALEIADMLIRSGAIDILVIDSVAALVPRAEIEGEMGDSHVGLQARLMSQALRKITGAIATSGTTAIFINQLREKIGVFFGCLSYGTRITLADGTQEKIGKIVNQKLPVEVLSYDAELGRIVPKKVVSWFDNGPTEQFLQLTVARPSGNGRAQLGLTANHLVRTPGGWSEAGDIIAGDRVMLSQPHQLSPFQWEVVLGGLMGDAALSPTRNGIGTRFRMGRRALPAGPQRPRQHAYLDWKASLFANIKQCRTTNAAGAAFVDLTPLPELAELREVVYFGDGKKHLSWDYLKALTPLSLAIWVMDDGCFTQRSKGVQDRTRGGTGRFEICVDAMSPASRARLQEHLRDHFGLPSRLMTRGKRGQQVLTFNTATTTKFQEFIAPYVHPSMDYKLLERFRGQFSVEPTFVETTMHPVPARVVDVRVKPPTRSMHRYDIEVEGSHNYLADGVVVHNSPETTTGGKALKFYASIRLDVRRIETLKDGQDGVGNRTRVKVVKNKCLASGTRVYDPVTGLTHTIDDIVTGRLPVSVVAADKAGELHARPVVDWFDQGVQDVIGLRIRDGVELWVTPDHKVLTDRGWRVAGDLAPGDRVARPRQLMGFGEARPMTADQARLLGYLIGDGYVGGKTPISFINVEPDLVEDATAVAAGLGCTAKPLADKISVALSHRPGEPNGVLALCRAAGIYGKLAWEKTIPVSLLAADVAEDVAANLVFGLLETDGWVSREQTGGLRIGYATTSEQLAHQLHWLLLRWGISSSVRVRKPNAQRSSLIGGRRVQGKRPCWEVRISGIDNVSTFAAAIPMWGPRGRVLVGELAKLDGRYRGSQHNYLPAAVSPAVFAHLRDRGISPQDAAALIGERAGNPRGGMPTVLGASRIRRDRLTRLADALDDPFLHELLADELAYSVIRAVLPTRQVPTFDVEVSEFHNLVAADVVVHNCAPPFKQAEFDIMWGHGISREGSLIDMGVDNGIVRKAGAWYTYDADQLGQGKENARAFLCDNPDLANEIEKKIKEKLGIGPRVDTPADAKGTVSGADPDAPIDLTADVVPTPVEF